MTLQPVSIVADLQKMFHLIGYLEKPNDNQVGMVNNRDLLRILLVDDGDAFLRVYCVRW